MEKEILFANPKLIKLIRLTPSKEYTSITWMEKAEFHIKFLGIVLSRRVRPEGWYQKTSDYEWNWKPIDRKSVADSSNDLLWDEKNQKIMMKARLCIYFHKDYQVLYFNTDEEAIEAARKINVSDSLVEIEH